MYLGKKKIIITAIVIAIIVIALVIGGLYVVLGTDLLKPTNLMFYKYANMQYQDLTNLNNNQAKDILIARNQMPFETNATIKIDMGEQPISYNMNTQSQTNNANNIELNVTAKEDVKNDKQYLKLKADYNKTNLIDMSYAKSNDIIAIQWEEIVKKYFIGIKNENIKDFAKRLGVQDTSMIPNKLESIDYLDLINITDEEKAHILETYLNVISSNIPNQNYTKQKDLVVVKNAVTYNTTAYRLDLSAEEIRNIVVKVLETLKQDSITLNLISTKAKILNLGKEYTEINNLVKEIDKIIKDINSENVDTSKGLSITIYEYKGKVLQTEILLKNDAKIILDSSYENNTEKVNININNLSSEDSFNIITMQISMQKSQNAIVEKININIDNEQAIVINKTSTGSVATGINDKTDISIETDRNQSINISYVANSKFGKFDEDIINLEHNKNCVVLNNYTDTQLQNLLNQIVNRVNYVIGQKMQIFIPINLTTNLY